MLLYNVHHQNDSYNNNNNFKELTELEKNREEYNSHSIKNRIELN